jgi:PAS domain S-box-containing protein
VAVPRSGTIARIISGRLARHAAAAIAVLLALLLRLALERRGITLPTYITFYPAVILAALLGGMWAGILGTALSALVVDYLLLPPIGRFAIHSTSDIVAMAIFCISGVSISFVTELYHRRGEKLAAFQIEAAVLEERRKTEEAHARAESIRAERQRFLDVLETLPPMISLLTPDRHIAFANRSFRERFGECRGQRCFEARFGRAEPCDFCESYSVFETGQPHHWEVIFPDGSLVDAHDFPFTDLDGSSLLLEMGVDITERRRSEVELKEYRDDLESQVAERTRQLQAANAQLEADMRERKEAQRVLGNTLQRFYAILSNLSSGVLLVTNEGRIEFANQAFCSLFGLKESPTDLVATFDSEKVIAKIDTAYENHEQAVLRVREILEREQSVLGEEVSMQNGGTYRRDFVALTVEGKSYGRMWVHTDITELKRKEEALRESRAKLEAALASMTDSVLITDAEGRFVEFNDAYARFYRFKSKAEFPRDFDEFASIFEVFLTTGEQAPREMYAIQRALRGETATNAEYTLRRKDTGESWIGSISFSPIRESAGAITGAVITARDITEAKRAETRLRRFYETDLFAILYWTIDGGVLDANDKFLAMTGYSRADLRAGLVDWVHMTPPEYEALDEDARRQVRETGVHLPFEKEFIRKDGSRIWGLISAVAYEDDRTQGISFLLDITKRKRAEEALRESEKRYRNLFNAMTEGFCIVEVLFDSDGKPEDYRFLEVNGAFERQTGLHDAAGKRMRELVPAHEEHWFEMYGKVALTGEPARFINEARALNRWYDVHAYRVGEPEMRRVAIVFDDFSDYKRAEEQLQKLNRTLEARSNSDQAILHATEEPAFLREVCRIITRDCGHAMVWIGVAEDDVRKTVRPVAHSGFEEGYLETLSVTWDESERGRGPTGTAIRTGQPSMCRDMHIDPAFAPWREDAVKRGYASSLVIPLKEQGVAWGAITIYSREPDAFTEGEVELLTELAGDLEFGIETLRLRAAHARAEEALRESEELLGLFVEHAPAALAMFDGQMRYLHASRRWRADYGLGDQELSGVSHYEVFPEIPELWKDAHRRGLAGEVLSGEADRFEKADGSVQWVRWEVRPWRDAEGEVGGIVIFSEEISERKKAQEALLRSEKLAYQRQQLQALAERLQQAREEERKMVARDLHDDIGQILTAIKMDMSWVVRHLPRANDEVHDRLKGSIELINDGVRSVRKICSGLRPGILDDLGLAAAIEWQSNEFAARTGISCQVSVPAGELVLDGDRATAIFRIFQECLTNVARHAEARTVRATLRAEDENLLLVVQDDGKGFRESEVAGSLGVLGMKERAQACGGSVQVSSSPGKGTTVTVRVPVRAPSAELEDHAYSDSR